MNRLENCNLQTALVPVAEHIIDFNGTGIDISELQDTGMIVLMVESVSGAGRTLDVEIEDGLTLGGAYASASPPVNFTQVGLTSAEEAITIYLEGLRNFIRAAVTIAGTSPVFRMGMILIGRTGNE